MRQATMAWTYIVSLFSCRTWREKCRMEVDNKIKYATNINLSAKIQFNIEIVVKYAII